MNYIKNISIKTKFILLASLIFVLLMSYSSQTYAMADLFNPIAKNSDYLIEKILKPVFGYDMGVDYEDNPFSSFSRVFLSGLVILAAILLIYNVTQSTIETANAGEMMGRKQALTWATARSIVGVGILFPIGKSGMCAIQYIILYMAAQGVLFADSAWEAFTSTSLKGNIYVSPTVKKTVLQNVKTLFLAQSCVDSAKRNASTLINGSTPNWGMKSNKSNISDNNVIQNYDDNSPSYNILTHNNMISSESLNYIYSYGDMNNKNEEYKNICGQFSLRKDPEIVNFNSSKMSPSDLIKREKLIETAEVKNKVKDIHVDLLNQLVSNKIPALSKMYYENLKTNSDKVPTLLRNELQKIVNEYVSVIKSKGLSLSNDVDNYKTIVKAMQKEGIAGAGSWFFKLSSMSNEINNVINEVPLIEVTNNLLTDNLNYKDLIGLNNRERLNQLSPTILSDLNQAKAFLDFSAANVNISSTGGNIKEKNTSKDADKIIQGALLTSGIDEAFTTTMGFKENNADLGLLADETENPLVQIQLLGNRLLNTAIVLMVTLATLIGAGGFLTGNAAAALTGSSLAFSVVVTLLTPLISAILFAIFIPSIMMAFYIPMIPFILWIGALIGWIVLIVEALFGGPMWAVTFLSPDPNGFVGKTGQGYMLILTLFLKPVLMVLGFVSALFLLTPIGKLLNNFFEIASSTIKATQLTGFMAWIAMLVIYCIVMNKVVMQIFGLIHKVPDSLLQWIGGGGQQLGQYAQGIEQGVSGGTATALLAANQIGNGVQGTAKNIADMARQKHMEKPQNATKDIDSALANNPVYNALMDENKELGREYERARKENEGDGFNKDEFENKINNNKMMMDHIRATEALKQAGINDIDAVNLNGGFIDSASLNQFLQNENMPLRGRNGFYGAGGTVSKKNIQSYLSYLEKNGGNAYLNSSTGLNSNLNQSQNINSGGFKVELDGQGVSNSTMQNIKNSIK